jgi:hypothetical protein
MPERQNGTLHRILRLHSQDRPRSPWMMSCEIVGFIVRVSACQTRVAVGFAKWRWQAFHKAPRRA